jgi:hypothetical protein
LTAAESNRARENPLGPQLMAADEMLDDRFANTPGFVPTREQATNELGLVSTACRLIDRLPFDSPKTRSQTIA